MIKWHIGCSGFYYRHWKEIFYPKNLPQRMWFEFYCTHFNTLELNVTFYRFPDISVLKKWYHKSTGDFSFSVKAPKLITHFKKFNDCDKLISDFYRSVQNGLKEKTGCLLFQLPPNYKYTDERLDKIIKNLDPVFPNVVEFRHNSWWNETVYTSLADHNISFSGMSHPLLPETVVANTSLMYYRMHGVPDLYKSLYSLKDMKKFVKAVERSKATVKAFVYFNNDIDGSAVKNAKEMVYLVSKRN